MKWAKQLRTIRSQTHTYTLTLIQSDLFYLIRLLLHAFLILPSNAYLCKTFILKKKGNKEKRKLIWSIEAKWRSHFCANNPLPLKTNIYLCYQFKISINLIQLKYRLPCIPFFDNWLIVLEVYIKITELNLLNSLL